MDLSTALGTLGYQPVECRRELEMDGAASLALVPISPWEETAWARPHSAAWEAPTGIPPQYLELAR